MALQLGPQPRKDAFGNPLHGQDAHATMNPLLAPPLLGGVAQRFRYQIDAFRTVAKETQSR
jgi:hypothetical protein